MKKDKQERVGEFYTNYQGYKMTIVAYRKASDCDVQLEDGSIIKSKSYRHIVTGGVKNPYHPSVFDRGYDGGGSYIKSNNKEYSKAGIAWYNVFTRCYSPLYHKGFPTYIGCEVSKEWYDFQIFAAWFEENYVEGFALDKDILFKGNKIYSPETCCFVPPEINSVFTKRENYRGNLPVGVTKFRNEFKSTINMNNDTVHLGLFDTPEEAFYAYKEAKENWIKELADKWKPEITPECYEALYNYQVEITD